MGEAETALLVPNDSELTHDGHTALSRKEKRKGRKKLKRKGRRQQAAEQARQEDEQALQDPSFLEEKAQALEKERLEHELQLQLWLRKEKEAQEEADRKRQEAAEAAVEVDDESAWDYVEEGPAEIIWEGNEIIVRKQKVKVPKAHRKEARSAEDDHPVSNPLLPESLYRSSVSKPLPSQNLAFEDHKKLSNNEHNPNFGTEQDKTHCPFHIKTGVCRFGVNCSRAHVYPDKSCTLLIKNMYNGPGLPLEHDEGLEYTDEEVLQNYEEFFDDVHGEFLKHGEIVNFKVCRNESSHLRGNVYVQFQSIESALTAYSALNGRFYAAKQITCEFVVVTRWRAALCGEYMRSHHKVCSHGTACNFLHCFRNPCGLYEWADWDNPPPRSFSATGRRSRGDYKEDEYNHKHHDRSDRHHREGFSSKSRRSHQYDSGRMSRERRHGRSCSYDSSCEESLPIDKDQVQKERRNRSSKERYKAGHSSKRSSEESMLVERDGLQKGKRHRSSERRSREGGDQTRRKEDARKRRHRSRSQDRHERKRHHGSRRVAEDKKIVLRRGHRSRSPESSKSDGGSSCELMQASYERYRPRSRSHSSVSLEQSPEDEAVSKRRNSRNSRDKRKRRHS